MNRAQSEVAAWSAAAVGLVGCLVGAFVEPALFPFAWLAASLFWISWPLGSMCLILVHALTGGEWGRVLRLDLSAGVGAILLAPLVAAPLALTGSRLYPWVDARVAEGLGNGFYLNLPWFLARCAVYFSVWLGLAWSIGQAARGPKPEATLASLAPTGLILLALTVTFASIDTIEALDPHFASSVFGLVTIAETGLQALAFAALLEGLARSRETRITESLGRLTLALAILWVYLEFVQLLIAWQSNLPREAAWYGPRLTGNWGGLAAFIATVHFALPFALLLSTRLRRSRAGVCFVSLLLLAGGVARSWWLVLPAAHASFGFTPLAALLGVGGVAVGLTLRALDETRIIRGATDHAA